MECGDDTHLSVANTSSGQLVICRKCLPKYESDNVKFISEDSDDFLSELLGIKEVIIKKSSRKRKSVKNGGGKRGGKQEDEQESQTLMQKLEKHIIYNLSKQQKILNLVPLSKL